MGRLAVVLGLALASIALALPGSARWIRRWVGQPRAGAGTSATGRAARRRGGRAGSERLGGSLGRGLTWVRRAIPGTQRGARSELEELADREAASAGVEEDASGDDLKVIEGIGPRIESVLKAAGIATYEELAETGTTRLEKVMKDAGTRLANPETWSEQARLAADGRWEELQELQKGLKGGRRVAAS